MASWPELSAGRHVNTYRGVVYVALAEASIMTQQIWGAAQSYKTAQTL